MYLMTPVRRAVRPDQNYYRQTRRQRMMRSVARGGASKGVTVLFFLIVAGLLGWWGWHAAGWHRWLGLGVAGVAGVLAIMSLFSSSRR